MRARSFAASRITREAEIDGRRGRGGDEAWYREWFGPEYLALYPHRDREEAEAAVGLFRSALEPDEGDRVLDLACGAGRHLGPLRRAGLRPVGLDLSRELLGRAAREQAAGKPPLLVRADMRRLPVAGGSLDHVASFFTSFGYFSTVGEDREVLGEMRRSLRPGGGFLLDFLHAAHVRANLVPEDRREVSGRTVLQRRRLEGPFVVKEIEIHRPDGTSEAYEERVRLYEPDELEAMLREAGLRPEMRVGSYDGSELGPCSERLILAGRKA